MSRLVMSGICLARYRIRLAGQTADGLVERQIQALGLGDDISVPRPLIGDIPLVSAPRVESESELLVNTADADHSPAFAARFRGWIRGRAQRIREFRSDINGISNISGGWGGIRTHGTLPRAAVFKTAALNHSATHPVSARCVFTTHSEETKQIIRPYSRGRLCLPCCPVHRLGARTRANRLTDHAVPRRIGSR